MKVIACQEFELASYDVTVQDIRLHSTGTTRPLKKILFFFKNEENVFLEKCLIIF